ncbi:MAG TPA: FAD-binding oxidoreductase [Dehalococcoidia bacterium]|nr:FAD-binding oxidoreductase [Dehalococcoidia bacterium]
MDDPVRRLRDALPADAIEPGVAEAVDALGGGRGAGMPPGVPPLAVVRPDSTAQVAQIVRIAAATGTPVVPYGGGTGLMGGARAVEPAIVIDLERLNRVRTLEREWAWVEAGAVLAEVNRALEPQGRMLGHDPWTVGIATVGGAISTNGLGFFGGKYGSMGEQVLALEAVLADGTVLATRPAAPRSTGIDLTRLFVAAEGTLGVITAAALRTFAVPESSVRRGFRFATFEAGFAALEEMHRIGLAPAILDYGERGGAWEAQAPTLYAGFIGVREEVDGQLRRLVDVCREATPIDQAEVDAFWAERHVPAERFARRRSSGSPDAGRCFDYVHVALPMSGVLRYRERARALAPAHGVDVVETGLWVHPGLFSMVMISEGADCAGRMASYVDACLRLAIAAGGSMEYCHGVGVRLAHLMREQHGAGLDVMRAIKRALDPQGILNPGKLDLA